MNVRNDNGERDFVDQLGDVFRTVWRLLRRLLREGNRRQLAFRNRKGETVVRLPLTIAALIALFLLWQAWPVLILLVIVAFAMRGSLVVLRREPAEG